MTFPIPPDALPLSPDELAGVRPLGVEEWQVLTYYNGAPLLCLVKTRSGVCLLAYCCAEDDDGAWFLLAPTTVEIVDDLENNRRLPLRDAILTPWLAVVHAPWEGWEDDPSWGYVIRPEDVPDTHLPQPGVMLRMC